MLFKQRDKKERVKGGGRMRERRRRETGKVLRAEGEHRRDD